MYGRLFIDDLIVHKQHFVDKTSNRLIFKRFACNTHTHALIDSTNFVNEFGFDSFLFFSLNRGKKTDFVVCVCFNYIETCSGLDISVRISR